MINFDTVVNMIINKLIIFIRTYSVAILLILLGLLSLGCFYMSGKVRDYESGTVISEDIVYGDDTLSDNIIAEDGALIKADTNRNEVLNESINTLSSNAVSANICSEHYMRPLPKDSWALILVSRTHPIPADYELELGHTKGYIKCDSRVVDRLEALINAAKEEKISLMVASPFRDTKRQRQVFANKKKQYRRLGYNVSESFRLAAETVAVPGTSEHEIGLAFDFITKRHTTLDAEFENTEAGIWLRENAANYGFILRYPRDKAAITGIEYEPWHYRYVGIVAAHEIMDNNITLEEYLQSIDTKAYSKENNNG